MSTAFDVLLDAFAAVLAESPAVCDNISTDGDDEPLASNLTEAITLALGTSSPQQMGGINGNPVDWVTEVLVHCYASSNGSSARPAAHAIALDAYARLADDPTLGIAVVSGVHIGEPAITRQTDKAATRVALVTLTYSVQHRTTGLTLS